MADKCESEQKCEYLQREKILVNLEFYIHKTTFQEQGQNIGIFR